MKLYVISGAPSTGKTSVINELAKEFKVLPEAARVIAEKNPRFRGKSIREIDKEEFQKAIFELKIKLIESLDKSENDIVFSDRGLGDTIAYYKFYNLEVPKKFLDYINKLKYAGIFVLDFLDFYEKDSLRQESREEAEEVQKRIIETYEELGYKIIKVPFTSVEERVNFIKNRVLKAK